MPERSIAYITRDAVLAAISEYDDIGQVAFLEKYGFGFSAKYLLHHGQQSYDSKAIMGAAFGYLPGNPAPLTLKEFHGGHVPSIDVARANLNPISLTEQRERDAGAWHLLHARVYAR